MIRETVNALLACVVTLVICAVAYPAAVWGLGCLLFPRQAAGSLIERDGKVVGSELIGQPFAADRYFHPRPSAAGANGYDASAASGSNLGTKNPALRQRIAASAAALKATADRPVPADLVTASGSGLDPDISPEAAHYQEAGVAAARRVPVEKVRKLVDARVETSGSIIGAPPRVNVLRLNLALDEEAPASAPAHPGPAATPAAALTPTPVPASTPRADEAPALAARIKDLAGRLDGLEARVGALPHPEGLKGAVEGLRGRVVRLVGAAEQVDRLTAHADGLDGRVREVNQAIAALRAELASTRETLKSAAARPARPR